MIFHDFSDNAYGHPSQVQVHGRSRKPARQRRQEEKMSAKKTGPDALMVSQCI
jgi:hypothetical protein